MKLRKDKVATLKTIGLGLVLIIVLTAKINASSNVEEAPSDWAFEASSIALNDAIVAEYPSYDSDNDGFISLVEASAFSSININSLGVSGTIYGIENFTNLEHLSLYDNNLSGEIPKKLGNLNDLDELDLNYNQLSGAIPAELGNLVNLKYLKLSVNQLSGELPIALGNLTNLLILELSVNQLTGAIPSEIINLTNLEYLLLDHNQLTSLNKETYESLLNYFASVSINAQTYRRTLKNGTIAKDYTFEALPIFDQVPTHANNSTITYTLIKPDETSITMIPTIVDGKITIDANELNQKGQYTFIANIAGGLLDDSEYQLNFMLEDEVEYLSVSADGSANKQTTTILTIKLAADVENLSVDDIKLSNNKITKKALTSLGNGSYELAIEGTWHEGTTTEVTLIKEGTRFVPETHSTLLHKADAMVDVDDNDNNDEDNNSNDNDNNNNNNNNKTKQKTDSKKNKKTELPESGYDLTLPLLLTILSLGGLGFNKLRRD